MIAKFGVRNILTGLGKNEPQKKHESNNNNMFQSSSVVGSFQEREFHYVPALRSNHGTNLVNYDYWGERNIKNNNNSSGSIWDIQMNYPQDMFDNNSNLMMNQNNNNLIRNDDLKKKNDSVNQYKHDNAQFRDLQISKGSSFSLKGAINNNHQIMNQNNNNLVGNSDDLPQNGDPQKILRNSLFQGNIKRRSVSSILEENNDLGLHIENNQISDSKGMAENYSRNNMPENIQFLENSQEKNLSDFQKSIEKNNGKFNADNKSADEKRLEYYKSLGEKKEERRNFNDNLLSYIENNQISDSKGMAENYSRNNMPENIQFLENSQEKNLSDFQKSIEKNNGKFNADNKSADEKRLEYYKSLGEKKEERRNFNDNLLSYIENNQISDSKGMAENYSGNNMFTDSSFSGNFNLEDFDSFGARNNNQMVNQDNDQNLRLNDHANSVLRGNRERENIKGNSRPRELTEKNSNQFSDKFLAKRISPYNLKKEEPVLVEEDERLEDMKSGSKGESDVFKETLSNIKQLLDSMKSTIIANIETMFELLAKSVEGLIKSVEDPIKAEVKQAKDKANHNNDDINDDKKKNVGNRKNVGPKNGKKGKGSRAFNLNN